MGAMSLHRKTQQQREALQLEVCALGGGGHRELTQPGMPSNKHAWSHTVLRKSCTQGTFWARFGAHRGSKQSVWETSRRRVTGTSPHVPVPLHIVIYRVVCPALIHKQEHTSSLCFQPLAEHTGSWPLHPALNPKCRKSTQSEPSSIDSNPNRQL